MRRRSAAALALALLLPLPGLAGEVVVKPGETLSELAERYGTSVDRLMQLNGLRTPQDLWAGSRIQVPGAGGASRTAAPVNRAAKQHTVQSGETLSQIADRYGIPMQRLVALNGLSKPDELMEGATLKLRSSSPAVVQPKPKPKPVAKAPVAVSTPKPAAKPVVLAATQPVAKPKPKPEPAVEVATATAAAKPAAKPIEKPIEKPAVATTTASPTATAPTATAPAAAKRPAPIAAKPTKGSAPDWRSYGPLQVDWANWMPMGGSYVAPSLNSDGQPLYLAVNCNAKRLNATGQSGAWKTWNAPQSDFEQQLLNDLCKAKGG